MQLDRSNRAFARWREQNLFLEAKVVKEANTSVRDLLLKGHLIPTELVDSAGRLIDTTTAGSRSTRRSAGGDRDLETRFVFAGPHGYPFPRDAERAFHPDVRPPARGGCTRRRRPPARPWARVASARARAARGSSRPSS